MRYLHDNPGDVIGATASESELNQFVQCLTRGWAGQILRNFIWFHILEEAIATNQKAIAVIQIDLLDLNVYLIGNPDSACDDIRRRMILSFFGRQLA